MKQANAKKLIPALIIGIFCVNPTFAADNVKNEKKTFYANGQLQSVYTYEDERKNGDFKIFDKNGNLLDYGVFKDDKLLDDNKNPFTGPRKVFYINGQLNSETNYSHGVRQGTAATYYETGKILSQLNFENGIVEGKYQEFYESGNPRVVGSIKNGAYDGEIRNY